MPNFKWKISINAPLPSFNQNFHKRGKKEKKNLVGAKVSFKSQQWFWKYISFE